MYSFSSLSKQLREIRTKYCKHNQTSVAIAVARSNFIDNKNQIAQEAILLNQKGEQFYG